jgi:hypothetical protein
MQGSIKQGKVFLIFLNTDALNNDDIACDHPDPHHSPIDMCYLLLAMVWRTTQF